MMPEDRESGGEEHGLLPFLSHSRLDRYLRCPEQYRLYYLERLRPKRPAASLVFGQAIHDALAALFRSGADPARVFIDAWGDAKQMELTYTQRESWEGLRETGQILLERFLHDEQRRVTRILAVEKPFRLAITGLGVPFVGVIDLVAELDGQAAVLDFKTAASRYEAHEVILSDQLSAYQLAEPRSAKTALCVLLKLKEPRIDWHFTERGGAHLTEYLGKAALLAEDIAAGRFYKRPGKWCGWCDYLPVCTGDKAKVRETLIQIR